MLWYIAVCSMIGGISVSVTTGLGAAIVQTALGDNQVSVIDSLYLDRIQLMGLISSSIGLCTSCWRSSSSHYVCRPLFSIAER